MLRVISLNLNGIRSAHKKGLEKWLKKVTPDVLCVQELKAQSADIDGVFHELAGLRGYFHCAEKKGYSGVGLYTRHEPSDVIYGLNHPEFDAEGRYVEVRFDTLQHKSSMISSYFPSGSSGDERQEVKYRFLDFMFPYLQNLAKQREFILCGDVNIAHQNIDLKNWKSNQKHSGFLPQERQWLTQLLNEAGLVDVFRCLNPNAEQFTWWSSRGQAWAKNVGWRIDYQLATPKFAQMAKAEFIYKEERFSDHAPLVIDYDLVL